MSKWKLCTDCGEKTSRLSGICNECWLYLDSQEVGFRRFCCNSCEVIFQSKEKLVTVECPQCKGEDVGQFVKRLA